MKLVRLRPTQERPAPSLLATLTQANVIALSRKDTAAEGAFRVVTRIANTYSEELATGSFQAQGQALRLLKFALPSGRQNRGCIARCRRRSASEMHPRHISARVTTIYNPVFSSRDGRAGC